MLRAAAGSATLSACVENLTRTCCVCCSPDSNALVAVSNAFSALTLLVWRQEGMWPVKNRVVGYWHGYLICLQRGADLHMAQLMPLPLTVSCFSKIQIGFTFMFPAHQGSPRQRDIKRVCVCVVDFNKGMRAVKLCANRILKFLTGSVG